VVSYGNGFVLVICEWSYMFCHPEADEAIGVGIFVVGGRKGISPGYIE
jgi:hypothetical protein